MDRFSGVFATVLVITVFTVRGQISTPCTASMIASFIPCVNFVMGSSANGGSPTAGCCKAVESLMTTSMECTCLIVTGNVPFSLPSSINQALAIRLPQACNSKRLPLQCKSSGVPLPPAGPALFVPPPPRALPPIADSPELSPSPGGPEAAALTPTPSEMSTDDVPDPDPRGFSPVAHNASTPMAQHSPPTAQHSPPTAQHSPPTAQHSPPTAQHSPPTAQHSPPTVGSGIRPVLTPASSASNWLKSSPPVTLLLLAAITVAHFREVLIF